MWRRLVAALLSSAVICMAELQELETATSCQPWNDADEGLELLQRRAASIVELSEHAKDLNTSSPPEAPLEKVNAVAAVTAAASAAVAAPKTMPAGNRTALTREEHLRAALAAYALLPSLIAVGLPILVNGCGVMEVTATASFWLLVRPASKLLQAFRMILGPPIPSGIEVPLRSPSLGFVPEALSAAAHFYWAWGLCEFAVRRRAFLQRFIAVLLLGLVLLPVPFVQFYLGHIGAYEVSVCAMLGECLGVMLFFSLRTTPCRRVLKELPSRDLWLKVLQNGDEAWACFYLHDNLTHWWGGCCWPAQRPSLAKTDLPSTSTSEVKQDRSKTVEQEEENPAAEDHSSEEDFEVVCQVKREWIEVVDSVTNSWPAETEQVSAAFAE